jgi:hypothetical protein
VYFVMIAYFHPKGASQPAIRGRRDSMRKAMIAVAAAVALGTATMSTGAMAHGGHGGVGGNFSAGHFSGSHFSGSHLSSGHFAGGFRDRHFGRHFRAGFAGVWPYYDYGYNNCYVLTPYGYAWVCN